jgi:hypothetical protein
MDRALTDMGQRAIERRDALQRRRRFLAREGGNAGVGLFEYRNAGFQPLYPSWENQRARLTNMVVERMGHYNAWDRGNNERIRAGRAEFHGLYPIQDNVDEYRRVIMADSAPAMLTNLFRHYIGNNIRPNDYVMFIGHDPRNDVAPYRTINIFIKYNELGEVLSRILDPFDYPVDNDDDDRDRNMQRYLLRAIETYMTSPELFLYNQSPIMLWNISADEPAIVPEYEEEEQQPPRRVRRPRGATLRLQRFVAQNRPQERYTLRSGRRRTPAFNRSLDQANRRGVKNVRFG